MLKRPEATRMVTPLPAAPSLDNGTRLLLQISGPKGKTLAFKMKDRVVVGCGGAHWELDLDMFPFGGEMAGVSRRHLAFTTDGEMIYAEDLNSECGTRINGVVMPAGRQIRLRNGDELALGGLLMTIRIVRTS